MKSNQNEPNSKLIIRLMSTFPNVTRLPHNGTVLSIIIHNVKISKIHFTFQDIIHIYKMQRMNTLTRRQTKTREELEAPTYLTSLPSNVVI